MIISPLTEPDKKMLKQGFSKKIYVVGYGHNNDLGHWVYKDKKYIFKIIKTLKMLVFKHPKYYEEMRRRAKREQELERKRASERASRREGGPASHEQGSEQASDQASDEDASKQR